MKSVLILGAGNFGSMLARQMNAQGFEIMIVDARESLINAVMPYVTDAQIGDCTNPTFLRSLGVDNYDLCVVSMSENFQTSLEATSLLKELGAKQVIARAKNEIQEKFLLRNGADAVVFPERQMANWTAIRYSSDHIENYIDVSDGYSIYEVRVPEEWDGKRIDEIDVRRKFGFSILGIRNIKMNMNPPHDTILRKEESMLVLGKDKELQQYFRMRR